MKQRNPTRMLFIQSTSVALTLLVTIGLLLGCCQTANANSEVDVTVKHNHYKTTTSGLKYKVLRSSTNGNHPSANSRVTVHYSGRFTDGRVFDSSYNRGKPITFPLNQVIVGWQEGLQLMKEGEKYDFYIPANLAYGNKSNGRIPPNTPLMFTVELITVH